MAEDSLHAFLNKGKETRNVIYMYAGFNFLQFLMPKSHLMPDSFKFVTDGLKSRINRLCNALARVRACLSAHQQCFFHDQWSQDPRFPMSSRLAM